MNKTKLQARLDATEAQIAAYEDAILALGSGVQSYELDTGQTKQRVTKLDLDKLNKTIDSLYNRCAMLEARLNGGHTIQVKPGW